MYLDRNKEDKICEEGIDDLGGKEEQAFSRLSFRSAFELRGKVVKNTLFVVLTPVVIIHYFAGRVF